MRRPNRTLKALILIGAMSSVAWASPVDDLASRKNDWNQVQRNLNDTTARVNRFLEQSKAVRSMDKTQLDALVNAVCREDITNRDEGERIANRLAESIVANARREFDNLVTEGDRLMGGDVERSLNDAKALRDRTSPLTSDPETKSDAESLLREMSSAIDSYTSNVYQRFNDDYRSLDNVKQGVLRGANDPKVRAAIEYGKEKHELNQRICDKKELVLSSGRPDCVTFQKDACAVWEFKPDTYSESEARSQAERYVRDLQQMFKGDPIAASCKMDSDGLPIFEAKGVTYPACRS